MKLFLVLAVAACVYAAEVKEKAEEKSEQNKEKRQTSEDVYAAYRSPRKQEITPVEEAPEDNDKDVSRSGTEVYRPGQVFSLNQHELLELQAERKAQGNQPLQQLYAEPQSDGKQGLQFYYLEPQVARQIALQPSHAVIARPSYTSNGGEASVGAALSVSDSGSSSSDSTFDQELLALLGQAPGREEPKQQAYSPAPPQPATQSIASQYQQIDRYITKPTKKPTKLQAKVHFNPPQLAAAPQQYLIETTNVQQQPQQQQQQLQRPAQALRYVSYQPLQSNHQPQQSIQQQQPSPAPTQPAYYEQPQGLKVVAAPKLANQQPRSQIAYRFVPQYQQIEASPKQYRILEQPQRQPIRHEQRIPAQSIERPVSYLKRFPEPEKFRSLKTYDQAIPEGYSTAPQPTQIAGGQYIIRQVYRSQEPAYRSQEPAYRSEEPAYRSQEPTYRGQEARFRYESSVGSELSRPEESVKPAHSAIYVSKNVAPKKLQRPQYIKYEPSLKVESRAQPSRQVVEQVKIEQHGQSLEEQRAHLPPPRNNKAYTPEEFAALVAAGYSVTPVPVSPSGAPIAQSRASAEAIPHQPRRILYSRRNQYLPVRDDAP